MRSRSTPGTPGRFGLVKPVDPTDPAAAETVAEWAAQDGTVAVRIMMAHGVSIDPGHPGVGRVLEAAARRSLPVNLLCWGLLDEAGGLARTHPDTVLVIDPPRAQAALRAARSLRSVRRPCRSSSPSRSAGTSW